MAWGIHPNVLPPDRRAKFQATLIPSALRYRFDTFGVMAAVPYSRRRRRRNTRREFSDSVSMRTTDFNLTTGFVQLMRDLPREQTAITIAAEPELAVRLQFEKPRHAQLRHVFDDKLRAVIIIWRLDQIDRLIGVKQSSEP